MTIHMDQTKTSHEALMAEMLRLMAENKALRESAPKPKSISYKVSEKGAISIYGLGRFPITLYVGQFDKLMDNLDGLKAFVEANRSKLSVKA